MCSYPQCYVHKNVDLLKNVRMHPCFLGDGEKRVSQNFLKKLLWYVDMGEDYTSQSRFGLGWYNPHLNSFYRCIAVHFQNSKIQKLVVCADKKMFLHLLPSEPELFWDFVLLAHLNFQFQRETFKIKLLASSTVSDFVFVVSICNTNDCFWTLKMASQKSSQISQNS